MAADAGRACEHATRESPWRRFGLVYAGVACQLAGDRAEAIVRLNEAVISAQGVVPVAAALAHAQLALAAADTDAWDDAAHPRAPRRRSWPRSQARPSVRVLSLVASAVAAAHPARSRRLVTTPPRPAAQLVSMPARAALAPPPSARRGSARAESASATGLAARALLAEARGSLTQVEDAPALERRGPCGLELADAFAESATGDAPTLTNAELRVLRQLPSHLSFREIGERLHVSTNTVKTQALSVYRKLDVSSRSEAVDRGRAAA